MKAEEILMRQEIRQMLNEAGVTPTSLKEMIQPVIDEKVTNAVNNYIAQTNMDKLIEAKIKSYLQEEIASAVAYHVGRSMNRMQISVSIQNVEGVKVMEDNK